MPGGSGRSESGLSTKKSRNNKMPKSSGDKNQRNVIETMAVNKISNE
jgi:hypothetical protein